MSQMVLRDCTEENSMTDESHFQFGQGYWKLDNSIVLQSVIQNVQLWVDCIVVRLLNEHCEDGILITDKISELFLFLFADNIATCTDAAIVLRHRVMVFRIIEELCKVVLCISKESGAVSFFINIWVLYIPVSNLGPKPKTIVAQSCNR